MDKYVKPLTWILGVVLALVGILGFVMPSPLLGLFEVDTNHNIVHLLSGIVAIVAVSVSTMYAVWYLRIFGIVYGLVAVIGLATGEVLGLIAINSADNWLHVAIAVPCLVVGFGSKPMASA